MPIGLTAAIVGSSLVGAGTSIWGAKKGSKAISQAAESANKGIYDNLKYSNARRYEGFLRNRETLQPYQRIGAEGRNALRGLDPNINVDPTIDLDANIDVGPTPLQGSRDEVMSRFYASPDYEFRRSEGLRDSKNYLNNTYGLGSGNALKALTEFNSNLAAGEFGDYVNRGNTDYALRYGTAADNYGRDYNRMAGNFARDYGLRSDNFARAHGVASEMTDLGVAGDNALINADTRYTDAIAGDALNAGYAYGNNLLTGAGAQAQGYQQAASGVNDAVQSGLGNYLYLRGRKSLTPKLSTPPQRDFQGRVINYG